MPAVLLMKPNILDLEKRFPMVTCTGYLQHQTMPYVSIDDYQAAYDAICVLLEKGYRNIAMLSVANGFLSTALREKGYLDALKDYGISIDPSMMIYGDLWFYLRCGSNFSLVGSRKIA